MKAALIVLFNKLLKHCNLIKFFPILNQGTDINKTNSLHPYQQLCDALLRHSSALS